MFDIKLYILKHFNKIKIVHSMPGRIRLKVSAMKNIPDEFKEYDKFVIKGIHFLDGIEDVSFNYILGTALVTYDVHKVYEEKVLSWIKKIMEISMKNIDFIEKYGEDNLDFVIDKMEQQLKDQVKVL